MVKKTSQIILFSVAALALIAASLPERAEAARQHPQGHARTSVNKPARAESRAPNRGNNADRANARNNNRASNNRSVSGNNRVGNNSNNNINVDRSRDVNVNVDGGGRGGYYDDYHHYHPIATAAAVTATVAVTSAIVGSIVNASQMPSNCVQVMRYNTAYMQCGSTWYQPQYQGSSVTYIVVNQP